MNMKHSQQNRKPIAAFEVAAIPVAQKGNHADALVACLQTILRKSHAAYDFAVEILYLGCRSDRRVKGSQCRIVLTIFAYGEGRQWGKNVLDMLNIRAELLATSLRNYNYVLCELQPAQLGDIHARLQAFQHKNILAPRRNVADVGHPVSTLAANIPADTAVSLLFTRDLSADCCRVSAIAMGQTAKELLHVKPYFQTWPMLSVRTSPKKGKYLHRRLCDAANLNELPKLVCKAIPWSSSARLVELPAGTACGMPSAAPSASDVQFPSGMLNGRPQDDGTVRVGYVEDGHKKVAVSLTREQLSRHVCVLGQTGSGKSTLLCSLIQHCVQANMRVLVLDLAGSLEFRGVVQQAIQGDIYTLHDPTSPYAVNPLEIEGLSFREVKSILSDFFEKYLGLFEPLPRLVKDVFASLPERNYTVPEFVSTFMLIFDSMLGYDGEVKTNLRSAMETRLRSFATVFGNARHTFRPAEFFRTDHLFELHQFSEMERTIFLGLVLNVLLGYVQEMRGKGNSYPPIVIFIDEIHTLLDTDKNDESRNSLLRLFRRMMAEGRKLGLWLVVADQRLDLLGSLLEEAGTKQVLRTDAACSDLARILRELYTEQHLPILNPGELYLRAPGMSKAVFLKVPSTAIKQVVNDEVVHHYMKKRGKLMSAPLPLHGSIPVATAVGAVEKAEKRPISMEDEARRIAYKDVLERILEYLYASKNGCEKLDWFSLDEYLRNTPCQVTDPEMVAAIKTYLKEAVRNLQVLAR